MDLIVTDHHLPHDVLPEAVAVVDPRRPDDHSPFKGLCGAGVAFKLCAALDGCMPEEMLEYCGGSGSGGHGSRCHAPDRREPHPGQGGSASADPDRLAGIEALLEETGLAGKPPLQPRISAMHWPRINAAGRMNSAVTALQWCCVRMRTGLQSWPASWGDQRRPAGDGTADPESCFGAAGPGPQAAWKIVILLWGQDWHPGVIGIVASRLVERTGRPVIVVSVDEQGEGKGSGRSVQGFNLHECIGALC